MEKKFEKPELITVLFKCDDIITSSNPFDPIGGGDDDPSMVDDD